jgi:hypothetical protein
LHVGSFEPQDRLFAEFKVERFAVRAGTTLQLLWLPMR